jgi:hypothetical protein
MLDWKIVLGTFVRQMLTGVATVLVAKEVIPPTLVEAFLNTGTAVVIGVVGLVSGFVWSLVSKKKALATPVN